MNNSSTDSSSLTPAVIKQIASLELILLVNASAVAILVYDYLLTFANEVECIWRQSVSPITALFFFVRYMPMIDSTLLFIHQFAPFSSKSTYAAVFKAQSWCYAIGLTGADIILVLRTCAIWGNDKRIAIGLGGLLAAVTISEVYCVTRYVISLQFARADGIPVLAGFFVSSADQIIVVVYASLVGFETVVLLLTIWKINKQQGKSALYKILYQDSLIFYIYIFSVSVANIIMLLVAHPDSLKLTIVQLHRILHSVFLGRIILNIRSAMARVPTVNDENAGAFTTYILGETTRDVRTAADSFSEDERESFLLD